MTQLKWISYGAGSPTVAANAVATQIGKLVTAGEDRPFANFGQGREQVSIPAELQDEILEHFYNAAKGGKLFDAAYNITANVGGTESQRKVARDWLKRFVGFDDETFIMHQTGRIALNETFKMFKTYDVVAPHEHWPMIMDIAADYGVKPVTPYALHRNRLADGIQNAVLSRPDAGTDFGRQIWYVGTPSNPQGLIASYEELQDLCQLIADLPQGQGKPVLFFDIPYFHAAERKTGNTSYLKTGFNSKFFSRLREQRVSYIASFSFSKALGAATPGISFMAVSPDLTDKMRKQMVRGSIGVSYSPQMNDALMTIFDEAHDEALLAHFKKLRMNYRRNCESLSDALHSIHEDWAAATGVSQAFLPLVDGDAAMTRLLRLPTNGIINRTVGVPESFGLPDNKLTIKTTNDFLSYMANVAGVVMVDNGFSHNGQYTLVRVATAEPRDRFAAGCQRLAQELLNVARGSHPA